MVRFDGGLGVYIYWRWRRDGVSIVDQGGILGLRTDLPRFTYILRDLFHTRYDMYNPQLNCRQMVPASVFC